MSDLRKEARGRDCMIRSPVCSCDREQTVLAHLRMVGISGAGHKAPDLCLDSGEFIPAAELNSR